jgi:hypothetical protein
VTATGQETRKPCEHGVEPSKFCSACYRYLRSEQGKAELIAFAAARPPSRIDCMNPYERAVREAEEWFKSDVQIELLQAIIKRAEAIGGHNHDAGPYQPKRSRSICENPEV